MLCPLFTLNIHSISFLPAEEPQLQHMQQAGELHSVPEQHCSPSGLLAEPRQLSVILQPEPAEHLDHDRRQHHEADQHPEPEEVPPAVKLGGHPHVRAPVYQEGAHSDDREGEIDPGILRKSRLLHDELRPGRFTLT